MYQAIKWYYCSYSTHVSQNDRDWGPHGNAGGQ